MWYLNKWNLNGFRRDTIFTTKGIECLTIKLMNSSNIEQIVMFQICKIERFLGDKSKHKQKRDKKKQHHTEYVMSLDKKIKR